MEMTVIQRDDNVSHVALVGRLDATSADEIEERFFAATSDRNQPAIVDLSKIDFMASRGIGLLFASTKRLKKAGHQLVLLNPQGMVEAVLKTSNMHRVMPLAHDLDEAIRIVGGHPRADGDRPTSTGGTTADRGEQVAAVGLAASNVNASLVLTVFSSLNCETTR